MEVALARPLPRASVSSRILPLLFAMAIFWSAALLFWIEPLVSKQLLPLLGGSPGVWNTCLVFFQAMLLAGYAFAHLVAARLEPRRAAWAYLAVLALATGALVFGLTSPAIHTEPGATAPIPWVLRTLLATVGLPFFALAATGPTLQRWFSLTAHPSARDPYFLYAASNLGSMIGLLAFPSLLEPFVTTSRQLSQWSAGYLALLALAIACAAALARWPAGATGPAEDVVASTGDAAPRATPAAEAAVGVRRRLRWLFLAFLPSSLLLGVTTYLSTDIAAVPLLWIVPLAIYLATFTLTFAAHPPIPHRWVLRAAPVVAAAWVVSIPVRWALPHWATFGIQLLLLFTVAMACHGELAKDRPAPRHLTGFYLWVSLGGVLGGAFNTLLAPVLFTGTTEYPLVILLAVLAIPSRPRRAGRTLSLSLDVLVPAAAWGLAALLFHLVRNEGDWWWGAAAAAPVLLALPFSGRSLRLALALAAVYVTGVAAERGSDRLLFGHRDFYGRIRVLAVADGKAHELMHGTTLHGKQNMLPRYRRNPLTYYSRRGPVGDVFRAIQARPLPARVAAVGLGTGTLAAYARPGERWTFYELNPVVEKVATNPRYFTYFTDALARPAIVLGDARLRIREAAPGAYDLIVLDAFSSDAIPIHLLTREAIRLYESKLARGGLVVFNVSNRYLDLDPVLAATARDNGLVAWHRDDEDLTSREENAGIDRSEWVALARSRADLGPLVRDTLWSELPPTRMRSWTDDFSGLLSILQW